MLQALTGASGIVALDRAQCAAYRLVAPQPVDAIAGALAAAGCDWALVPRARRLERLRLVAMDMDSTLITIECIDEIAALRGIKPEVAAITASLRVTARARRAHAARLGRLHLLHRSAAGRALDRLGDRERARGCGGPADRTRGRLERRRGRESRADRAACRSVARQRRHRRRHRRR